MAHQYSRVGFKSSVEVNEVNLSLSYAGGVLLNLHVVTGPAGSGHRKRNIHLNGFVGVGRTHRTTILDNNLRE